MNKRTMKSAGKLAVAAVTAAKALSRRKAPAKRTKTKRFQTIRKGSGATSVTSISNKLPSFMKQVFKQNEDQAFVTNTSARVTAANGAQAVYAWTSLDTGTFGSGSDINKIMEQANGGAALSGVSKTIRLYLGKCKTNFTMSNNQTNNLFIDLYDVVARKDHSQTISGSFGSGLIDQGVSVGAAAINVTPYMSQTFCTHWKIVKKTTIELTPGESHRHVFNYAVNKQINAERMQSGAWYWAGITHGTMAVAYGAPDHDATTVSNVSTGSVLLDVVYSKQQKYTFCNVAVSNTKYTTALPVLITERNVNEESGTPATVAS